MAYASGRHQTQYRGLQLHCRPQQALPRRAQRCGRLRCKAKALDSPQGTVICLGEALFDCLADQKGVPRDKVKSWTPYPGGAPANVACAVAKHDCKSAFITALGQDELAQKMIKLLESLRVDLSGLQQNDKPTRDVLVVFDDSGDREFVGFGSAKNGEFADAFLEAGKLPADAIRNASALVTGTLGLNFPVTAKAMHKALEYAREGPCKVLVDVNWRPVFWDDHETAPQQIREYVDKADILKLSDDEAEIIYGVEHGTALDKPESVLEKTSDKVQGLLLSAGAKGCSYIFRNNKGGTFKGRVPVFKIDVQDTTGAGDAFLSGFLASMVKAGGMEALQADEKKLRYAVEFATACGAFTTTKLGAIDAQPTPKDAEELLKTRDFA
ncbi:hypothetical protein WJX73_000806 [Symbiochloris irregularis]|uniref:Carbohydrate kinase PfkB domain-containing protein n=1 Tax=Symbiochloris irregularis TaxID=706552 RepID=A0AAW1PES9_9CHLO